MLLKSTLGNRATSFFYRWTSWMWLSPCVASCWNDCLRVRGNLLLSLFVLSCKLTRSWFEYSGIIWKSPPRQQPAIEEHHSLLSDVIVYECEAELCVLSRYLLWVLEGVFAVAWTKSAGRVPWNINHASVFLRRHHSHSQRIGLCFGLGALLDLLLVLCSLKMPGIREWLNYSFRPAAFKAQHRWQ